MASIFWMLLFFSSSGARACAIASMIDALKVPNIPRMLERSIPENGRFEVEDGLSAGAPGFTVSGGASGCSFFFPRSRSAVRNLDGFSSARSSAPVTTSARNPASTVPAMMISVAASKTMITEPVPTVIRNRSGRRRLSLTFTPP